MSVPWGDMFRSHTCFKALVAMSERMQPKSRADEDKLGNGVHKLMEEDPMLRFFRDEQTHEFLVSGTGQQHIEVIVSKLKKRYNTEVKAVFGSGPG